MRRFLIPALVLISALFVWIGASESSIDTLSPDSKPARAPAGFGAASALRAHADSTSVGRQALQPEPAARELGLQLGVPLAHLGVDVSVQNTWKADAERFEGMGFVVGIARDAQHADGPVGEHKRLLVRGVSGPDGSAQVELAVAQSVLDDFGSEARIWGQVAHPGKRAYLRVTALPEHDERVSLLLFPRSGASLTGRVLCSDGTPAQGADVKLFPARPPESEWVLNEDWARTDAHGGFQVDADEAGLFDLQVSASRLGTAGLRGVQIDSNGETAYVELQLSGDGVIAGKLLDPSGAPVCLYRLWCLPAEHRDVHIGYLRAPQVVPHEWGGGLYGDHATTDDQGLFRFTGLREGLYHLRGHTAKTGYYEELLTERAVPTGTEDLELRFARHRVLARVLDHQGNRALLHSDHRPQCEELPMHALYIEECDAQGKLLQTRRRTHDTRERLDNGDLVLDVLPGRSYVLGVFSRECSLVEQRFDVTPGDFERVITVQLSPPAPNTVLEVSLQEPNGEPLACENTQRLYAPESGRLLWEGRDHNRQPTLKLAVGPGRYDWQADAEPSAGHHGERWKATPYLPTSETLDVFAARTNRFERRLGASGGFALLVNASELPEQFVATSRRELDALDREGRLRVFSGGAAVRLEAAGKVLSPQFFHRSGQAGVILFNQLGSWVLPGSRSTTMSPISPGRYRLVVELEGRETRSQSVEIRAGEVTEVTLSFDDRAKPR